MAFVKPIREIGIVISKKYSEAKKEREFNGQLYPAKEEEFLLDVISCDEDDLREDTGISNGTRADYKVDKETFDKVKFGMFAKVKYFASQYGDKPVNIKTESFELLEKAPFNFGAKNIK